MILDRKNLWRMALLVAASVVLGVGANFVSKKPLPLLRPLPKPGAGMPAITEVDAEFVEQMRAAPGTLLIDARSADSFRSGRVPGALSLPLGEFAAVYPFLESRLRQAKLLILYCSEPTCEDSPELARWLWDKGLKKLLLFRGGMEEWSGRGYAVER